MDDIESRSSWSRPARRALIAGRPGSNAWFFSYGLIGFTQSGLLPVLMPLAGRGAATGLTFAAFSLFGVVAPFLGSWADRVGCHRYLLAWGATMGGLFLLPMGRVPVPIQLLLAAGAGLAVAATTTAGTVLAVQDKPEASWDDRVALLQRCISAGQVLGLLAAGALGSRDPALGLATGGGALLAAGLLSFIFAPPCTPGRMIVKPRPLPMVGGDAGISRSTSRAHHLAWSELRPYLQTIGVPLRQLLLVWLVAYPAMNGFAALFPVAMVREYGMHPLWPSGCYALGVAASLLLYPLVGRLSRDHGGARMLITGMGLRLITLGTMGMAAVAHCWFAGWLALFGFALLQFVWPFLAVGANSLAVRMGPTGRGRSVGLFNAVTSLSSAIGAALGGVIFDRIGFTGLVWITFLVVFVALGLNLLWRSGWERAIAPVLSTARAR